VGADSIWWIPSQRRNFDVRSIYLRLSTLTSSSFLWKTIWRVNVPLRVSFYAWTTTLRKILTLDNLREKKVIVVNWCSMCKRSVESIDYLFLHCEVARELYRL
jgi:hypothetical protein